MLKELFLAIILGALLGFGLTGGYLAINKKNNSNKDITTIVTPTPQSIENTSTQEITQTEEGFSFISVEDMDVVSKENIAIDGITNSPNNIVIATLGDQVINTTSKDDGKFSLQIKLTSGLNNIKITVIDSSNNQFEKNINITYSTATI
jgi:hypothetical protein